MLFNVRAKMRGIQCGHNSDVVCVEENLTVNDCEHVANKDEQILKSHSIITSCDDGLEVFPVFFFFSSIAFSVFDGATLKNSHKIDACRHFKLLPAGIRIKKINKHKWKQKASACSQSVENLIFLCTAASFGETSQ